MSDQPAFPHTETVVKMGTKFNEYHPGLTKREWFAGMAMQGLVIAMTNRRDEPGYDDPGAIFEAAVRSVEAADRLIARLEAPNAE